MKKYILITLTFAVVWLQTVSVYGELKKEEFFDFVKPGKNARVKVSNINGNINISRSKESNITIYAVKKTYAGKEELNKVEVTVSKGDEIVIKTIYVKESANVSVDYNITIPDDIALQDVNNLNGDINIIGVNGSISAVTLNGNIDIGETKSILKAKTSNGSIKVILSEINDKVNIETHNGAIEIFLSSNLDADVQVEIANGKIETHSACLSVNDLSGTFLGGKTGKGNKKLYIKSFNGNIDLYDQKK